MSVFEANGPGAFRLAVTATGTVALTSAQVSMLFGGHRLAPPRADMGTNIGRLNIAFPPFLLV